MTRGATRSEVNTLYYGQRGNSLFYFVVVITRNISTAVVATSGDKPLTRRDLPASPTTSNVSKKPTPTKQKAVPPMAPATAPPAANVAGPSSDVRAMSKDKGKGCALPGPYIDKVPAGIPSCEDDPYGYSLAFDDNEYDNEYAADYAPTPTSDMTARVAAILMGTAPAGNSASSSRERGEPAVLHLRNITEFQLAMESMEAAHRKGNDQKMDLLASLRKVVSLTHKAGKSQSPLEKSITKA